MEYSDKELQLIEAMGWPRSTYLAPLTLYRAMADDCFIANRQDDVADSLRRCMKAIRDCKPYRLTPEWDDMIVLNERRELHKRQ